jgi:aryl-alcohol dehydrogenase-like predicted oxidoreductase
MTLPRRAARYLSGMDSARLGIGVAAVGRPAYINLGRSGVLPARRDVAAMRAAAFEVLDAAYAGGVRWVDAARSYGRGEEFVAQWLDERGHDDVTVSSKWGYRYVGGWRTDADVHEVKEHSLEQFRTQLSETRALLGPRLALYQVHSLTAGSPLLGDEPLLAALARLAESGVRVGFSTSGPRQAETVRRGMEAEACGVRVFSAVQSTWNLLETSVAGALAEAHDSGAHVLVKEVLANGRLAAAPPPAVTAAARRHGTGPDAVALAAALAQPWADTVLLGAASAGQVASNLRAEKVRLGAAELAGLQALAVAPERYWAERSELPWI